MQLRELGEFDLIRRIKRAVARGGGEGPAVALGMGDDAALLRLRSNEELAVSTDAFVEGVHFRAEIDSPTILGRRSYAAALSDLAAMGARPLGVVVALAAPPDLSVAWVDRWLRGLLRGAVDWKAPLVGGNLARASEISFTATVHGAVPKRRGLLRSDAKPGDRVYVTGELGRSALDFARADAGKGMRKHVPTPRLVAGQKLRGLPGRGACVDISDGIGADLGHLLRASQVGAELVSERLPRPRGFDAACRALGVNPQTLLAAGGEDYELLFTLRGKPLSEETLSRRLGVRVTQVGRITRERGLRGLEQIPGFTHF